MLDNRNEEYSTQYFKLFPSVDGHTKIKIVTFQVTEDCNLGCTYCYQGNKSCNSMSFDVVRATIDKIIDNRNNPKSSWYKEICKGFVFEFIGGEPLLKIDLIQQSADYIESRFMELEDVDWDINHMYSISTNGTLYFDDRVQNFLKTYKDKTAMSVTVDGCKELHDSCRVFKGTTKGSYDLAMKAALDNSKLGTRNTKLTFSPDNIGYVYKGIVNMIENGFDVINCNVVYEKGWEPKHAKIYFYELKKVADYLIENNLQDVVYIRVLDVRQCTPHILKDEYCKNYCGVSEDGAMSAIDYNGDIYPCLRFMKSSLGKERTPLKLGNVYDDSGDLNKEVFKILSNATVENMSPKECLTCPIMGGCAWCTALCYQEEGEINHRTTYHCLMHVAEAIVTKYYQTRVEGSSNIMLPEEKIKEFLTEEELKILEV